MIFSSPCMCGHSVWEHRFMKMECQRDQFYKRDYCDCKQFKKDNLRYLEQKALDK